MLKRHIEATLREAMSDTPVVLLTGARQTGKSTLVESIAQPGHAARYVTLDDLTVLAAAKRDPAGFVAGLVEAETAPVIIDEIQRAPDLFLPIKLAVDRKRTPGRFLLTGSANIMTLPRLADSLAGRMETINLWPLSQGEIAGVKESFIDQLFAAELKLPPRAREGRAELIARVARGGYPEVLSRGTESRRRAWFGAYLATILQRDVRELSNIEGLTELPRLLTLLAGRTASLLNLADVSRALSIPQTTLKRYLALLEATFVVQPVPAWSVNLGKRLVKAAKLALCDTGLLTYLLGAGEERLAEDNQAFGPILENFVVMELRKQASWSETQPQLFHFRTQAGAEVDIVLEGGARQIVGIEVKSSASVGAADLKGLTALREAAGRNFKRGIILYTGVEAVSFSEDMIALPIPRLWQGVGV
ncbi:MAG: ATP-binding protein [Acidobacteriota bacterium]